MCERAVRVSRPPLIVVLTRSVLLSNDQRVHLLQRLRATSVVGQRERVLKEAAAEMRKKRVCAWCNFYNGSVKKVGVLKLMHERYGDTIFARRRSHVAPQRNAKNAARQAQRSCSYRRSL